ncbi:uncharacterized protein DNG_10443 [Cephalotrichum gorgonifer]|uniref:Uncharacterized protein n=1 Tax=Cephalotrichum gorgonifer TaxID=2041049 RepID=A0AAE8N907_9PEZI|nr:uncharacterized protein DNG_10443 [Cephalotrichum gorgonifer]
MAAIDGTPPSKTTSSQSLHDDSTSQVKPSIDRGLGVETLEILSTPVRPNRRRMFLLSATGESYLPGQPRIPLPQKADATSNSGNDGELGARDGRQVPSGNEDEAQSKGEDDLLKYLRESHLTKELDSLLPFMKYIFVQTPSFRHIMPLHHQQAHAREIIVNEHPGLHLVWYYEKIFIKPIPAYFFSAKFWSYLSEADDEVHRAAIGFMRSYWFLIKYEIDYDLACERKLIPKKTLTPDRDGTGKDKDDRYPTYAEFCRFISQFYENVHDRDTNRRFHYGELRLTRINRTSLIFKGSLAYFHIYPQWGSNLVHFLAPIIMVLGGCSVVLNAMQVTLNAQEMLGGDGTGGKDSKGGEDSTGLPPVWSYFTWASLYFPVTIIIVIASILAVSLAGILAMGFKDLVWAKTTRRRKRHGDPDAGNKSHGLIW